MTFLIFSPSRDICSKEIILLTTRSRRRFTASLFGRPWRALQYPKFKSPEVFFNGLACAVVAPFEFLGFVGDILSSAQAFQISATCQIFCLAVPRSHPSGKQSETNGRAWKDCRALFWCEANPALHNICT